MFKKILIANRGEIACRVAATAKRMGIKTVAVYSDADAQAKHVQVCDEAVHIGGSAPKDSYLRWERILQAAKDTGAQAVHPGYGFLSENAKFAEQCESCNIKFIGPKSKSIKMMGDKSIAKDTVRKAGVPIVPGSEAPSVDPAAIAALLFLRLDHHAGAELRPEVEPDLEAITFKALGCSRSVSRTWI